MKIVNGWLNEAIEIDYTNRSDSRDGYAIKYIVIHSTAGGNDAEETARFFRDGNREASAHFIIDQQGKIVQGIPLSLMAWANGFISPSHAPFISEKINPNKYTVSIEFVKSSIDNSDALTSIQTKKGCEVIECICNTYNIPKRAGDAIGGIIKHSEISNTACPGPIPWSEFWKYLARNQPQPEEDIVIDLTNGTVASHFSADGTAWKCTNGFTIHGEILEKYRRYGKEALCGLSFLGLPKSNEIPVLGHPGVVYQRFERGVLCFDPVPHAIDTPPGLEQARVYPMHIDSGVGQDPRVTTLQGENAALKALLASSNLGQISKIGKQIADDVALIMKLSSVQ